MLRDHVRPIRIGGDVHRLEWILPHIVELAGRHAAAVLPPLDVAPAVSPHGVAKKRTEVFDFSRVDLEGGLSRR